MLDANSNRINFGEALRPQNGYELDFAIGTSYSLDLEAIMFLPISLFFGGDFRVEKNISNELLSALTRVPEKVLLFCQKGNIKTPPFYSEILAFWEKSIIQVHLDSYDKAFHPKIWLIRYKHRDEKKPIKYKFICTSRNLTQSKDWDIAITFDGEVDKTQKVAQNQSLTDFIKYLTKYSDKVPKNLLKEINHITFDFGEFDNVLFHPIGIGKSVPLLNADFKTDQLMIISPFLHEKTLAEYLTRNKKVLLFSSINELQKINREILRKMKSVYQFNPILENGFGSVDYSTEDGNSGIDDSLQEYDTGQNLHAKLYVTQSGEKINWFIGSANCTNPAKEKNVEFLVEIESSNKKLYTPERLTNQLLKKEGENGGSLFEIFDINSPLEKNSEQERLELDLRRIIYEISVAVLTGEVNKTEDGLFNLELFISNLEITDIGNWKVFVRPISINDDFDQEVLLSRDKSNYSFFGFEQHRLTPFFCFNIKNNEDLSVKNFILKIDVDLGENRDKAILKYLLGNQEKLFKFLIFLLAEDQIEPVLYFEEQDSLKYEMNKKNQKNDSAQQFPLYEKLLYAASRDSQSLESVITIVENLKDESDDNGQPLISPQFYELINVFKNFNI
ncbi:hypothetical protein [Dysgonomonas capnocytophagoides]|uniref:hypothetical protein n=1 Tax=Dysgonomonas capnocytophagoides TaxID=45254 RepID=UPI0039963344